MTVRFTASEYTTTESLGYAEVCIEIKGGKKRAPRNFNLTLSTQTGSAGDNGIRVSVALYIKVV